MKVAISLPDDLAHELDACAKRLGMPRSQLIAAGARAILERYAAADATAAWNAAIEEAGQPGDEPAVAELRRRSKSAVGRASSVSSTQRWFLRLEA